MYRYHCGLPPSVTNTCFLKSGAVHEHDAGAYRPISNPTGKESGSHWAPGPGLPLWASPPQLNIYMTYTHSKA